ncbi:MAG: DUF1786 family protein [Desulfovibrio aminophilus]|uniref:DUF1786 family protein n=1 Tax=Desulfovibrio aminophilus TaxID=81425 RepID=UPI0039ED2308
MPGTLILDIGSGTQDVFYHQPGLRLENCPKFVLPTPARAVAARLRALSEAGRHVWLHGRNMGGGFGGALREHLKRGLKAAATRNAAHSLGDDLTRIEGMGVLLTEECPPDHAPLLLTDFDPDFWHRLLNAAGLPWPERIAAAAQDHGFHPGGPGSNRRGRFRLWERILLESEGRPEALIFDVPPPEMTRLADLQASMGGGPVADTGAAAVLGALFDDGLRALSEERGVLVVNVGNGHTVAFLIHQDRILGVYEHHTGMIEAPVLWDHLKRFRSGTLNSAEVFDTGGHGCLRLDPPRSAGDFTPTFVLGPRRDLLTPYGVSFPAPGGDMMLAGCFGLLHGLRLRGLED